MSVIRALTLNYSLEIPDMKAWKSISTKLSDRSQSTRVSFDLQKLQQYHNAVSLRVNTAREHLVKLERLIDNSTSWPKIHHIGEKVTIEMPESFKSYDPIRSYLVELDGFFHSLYSALETFAGEINLCYSLELPKPTLREVAKKIVKIHEKEPMAATISKFVNSDFYNHFADTRHLIAHNIGLALTYFIDTSHQGEITPQNLCLPDNPKTWPFSVKKQLKTIPYCENALKSIKSFLENSYGILETFLFI